jgi:hypothetical protein
MAVSLMSAVYWEGSREEHSNVDTGCDSHAPIFSYHFCLVLVALLLLERRVTCVFQHQK